MVWRKVDPTNQEFIMRKSTALSLLALTILFSTHAQAGGPAKGVVELFTSQGCSDCPPADRTLGELTNKGGVITLAWHVDYWDYLGWRDTFSSKSATNRQEAYNRTIGAGVFTPQFVVNGRSSGLGGQNGGLPVAVNVKNNGGSISVSAGAGSGSANLYLVTYSNSSTVAIQRGENRGRSVNYRHVVSGLRNIGSWNGSPVNIKVPHGGSGCAVILQRGTNGPILGAAACS
jgi:hypothetical protein